MNKGTEAIISLSLAQNLCTTDSNHKVKLVSQTSRLNQPDKFQKETLVTNGKYFGIVSKIIANSDNPIQISWWESNSENVYEKLCYSLDTLQALKITPLPLFLPQKTFVIIPRGTLVLTENNNWVQWTETLFWIKDINETGYHLVNPEEYWIFPIKNFPGIPFACVNSLPSLAALEAAKRLSVTDIKIKAGLWLFKNSPLNLLEQIHKYPEIQGDMYEQFKASNYLQQEDYLNKDLATGWEAALLQFLNEKKHTHGLYNFQISTRVVQSTLIDSKQNKYNYQFGVVTNLELDAKNPVIIQWEEENKVNRYSEETLKNNNISPICISINLSNQVGYEKSNDGKFYQVFVGFHSKSAANSWQRSLKRELGDTSELIPNYNSRVQHLKNQVNTKYFYLIQNHRQKTWTARQRHLLKVVSWNLKETKST